MPSGALPPLAEVTPDDHAGLIHDTAFTGITVLTIIAIIRFVLAVRHKISFQWDDATFVAAVLLAVADSVCYHKAAVNGLGKHQNTLQPAELDRFYKFIYSGDLLLIMALGMAKLSLLFLFLRISDFHAVRFRITGYIIGVWIAFGLFGRAFQCGVPRPWDSSPAHCSGHGIVRVISTIGNMATDLLLCIVILPTVWELQMERRKKLHIMLLFGSRIVVPIATTSQLVFYIRSLHEQDQTWETVGSSIWSL
jgi:hypothetical protein